MLLIHPQINCKCSFDHPKLIKLYSYSKNDYSIQTHHLGLNMVNASYVAYFFYVHVYWQICHLCSCSVLLSQVSMSVLMVYLIGHKLLTFIYSMYHIENTMKSFPLHILSIFFLSSFLPPPSSFFGLRQAHSRQEVQQWSAIQEKSPQRTQLAHVRQFHSGKNCTIFSVRFVTVRIN